MGEEARFSGGSRKSSGLRKIKEQGNERGQGEDHVESEPEMSERSSIDLRPMLAQGVDPLTAVIERAQQVKSRGALELLAPFDPLPLRRILAQMGFTSMARQLAAGHWQISLLRDGQGRIDGAAGDEVCRGPADVGAPVRREADGLHIDVRGLEAPQPMVAILRLCASLEDGAAVIVHHERDPIYLYPELAELGWSAQPVPAPEGEVRLRLTRDAA